MSRYELCPRASSPLADSDLSLLSLNHFLLPHGPFSFPSANLSSTPLHTPPNLPPHKPPQNISSPHHLELYIQEALYLPHLHQLQLAVISLPGGQLPRKNLLYDWERTEMAMDLMAAGLEVETSLGVGGGGGGGRGRRVGLGEARLVGQVYWLHFPMVEESKGEPLRDHFTVDLFHDHFTSTSSRCVGDGAWCRRSAAAADSSSSSAPFLRVSVCLRSYPRVSVSMCSSALHSPAVMPHLRAWLTYHAVLGVQRFVIYDHGYYEEALRPYVEAGLVEWRYWPLPNRNFSQDTGADFSQLSLIVVCGALADVTSDYVLYFDTDEWLNFPSHDLTADELQGALPSEPELQPLQQGKLQPSTCLGFRKSPLTVDPDVRLDLSAHATAAVPALRCESVLERFLSAYRLSMIRRRVHRLRELHAQLMLATDAKSEEYGSLHSRYTKLRTTPSDPTDFPLFVYNFVETHAERQTREANELTAHSSHTQRVLAHNTSTSGAASAVVHYFAAAPQRFHRRLRIYRAGRDHKAIYRTPVRRDLWIHPLIPLDEFVNPNALRINHYGSIIHTRWLTEDEKVPRSTHTRVSHDAAPLLSLQCRRPVCAV